MKEPTPEAAIKPVAKRVGSLFAGTLADSIGALQTVIVSGICCTLGAAWFFTRLFEVREHMRPVYEQLGIIPSPFRRT